ncbi:MAG: HDIG domain-containing protein, partial [Spirochaetales bacterium]|nr:HDIG domain-containing protein [Spirochaetales bacterium]
MRPKKNNRFFEYVRGISLLRVISFSLAYLVVISALVITGFSRASAYSALLANYSAGSAAPRDIVLPQDLEYMDAFETERQRRESEMRMMPVFFYDTDAFEKTKRKIDAFGLYLAKIKNQAGASGAGDRGEGDEGFSGLFQPNELDFIMSAFQGGFPAERLYRYAELILGEGYYAVPWNVRDLYPKGLIEVFFGEDVSSPSRIVDVNTVITRKNFRDVFFTQAAEERLSQEMAQAFFIAAYAFFEENVRYSQAATLQRLERIRKDLRPVMRRISGGTVLVEKGSVITEEDREKLRLLAYSFEAKNSRDFWGLCTYLLLLLFITMILLRPPMLERRLGERQFVFLTILNTLYFVSATLIYRFIALPEHFPAAVILPTALVTMLISVLISYRAGLLNTAVLSLGQILLPAVSPEAIAFVFFSGVIGTRVVRKAEKRIDLLNAGMLLTLEQAVAAIILSALAGYAGYLFFGVVLSAALSGLIWGILNLTLLPLIENIMRAATKFRLMELSDLNTPTMKKLLNLAPGTYSHSISVGNLAETACREIGANALLARVGAYYHDIGKIDNAEYFIENQSGFNKHDYLKPGLSSTIIKSHVKIGLEEAAKLRLPDEVKDIIGQHHGHGVIRFFYQKALSGGDAQAVEEDYTYTGSPPQSREAAVVMLADSVEAASRLFKKPTVGAIEKAVAGIFREKMNSGQLSEAQISLRDLYTTQECFVKVLAGYFHSRIE